jgi:hypothetical protein
MLGGGQGLGQRTAVLGGGRLGGALLQGRRGQPLEERIGTQLGRMLDEVAGDLGRGGDDGVEEPLLAGRVDDTAQHARGRGIAALDRRGGQQYLALQRLPRGRSIQGH